jgi:large conductance mechanosensitive channel
MAHFLLLNQRGAILSPAGTRRIALKGIHSDNLRGYWRFVQFNNSGGNVGLLNDFKAFAVKGNVVDLAVAVIIGGAFSGIVKSLVDDVIMPIVGRIFGKLDFSNLYMPLAEVPTTVAPTLTAVREAGIPVLAYGSFISVLINFIILAFIIFMMVRQVNKLTASLTKEEESAPAAPPPTPEDVLLLREIRDALTETSKNKS